MVDSTLEFIFHFCLNRKIVRVFYIYGRYLIPENPKKNIHVLYNQIEHEVDVQKWTSSLWLSRSKFCM